MWLQLFLMILALIVYQNFYSRGDTQATRHKYVTFLIVILVLQSALRHLSVGVDTLSYSHEWDTITNKSWPAIWQNFYDVYVNGIGKDGGYEVLFKLLGYICPNFRIFMFLFAIIFFISLFRLVEDNLSSLKQIYIAFCLYQVLFYSFFSITGMRQGMATIATFYCYRLIKENKLIKFLVILFIMSFVHKSVLLFVPFFFIAKVPKSRLILTCVFVAFPVIFGLARPLAAIMVDFSGAENYRMYAESEMETSGAVNFMILILVISILTWISKKRFPEVIPDSIVHAMSLAVIFTPLMWVDTSLMRVIQYFSIFSLIALPLAIDSVIQDKKTTNMLYWALWIVFMAVTIRHNYEYAFMWEDVSYIRVNN